MAARVTGPAALGTEPEVVRCPACRQTGQSIRTMELVSNAQSAASAAIGLLGLLSCQCIYLAAPTYFFLEHFCRHCGIRLAVVPWADTALAQIDRELLSRPHPPSPPAGQASSELEIEPARIAAPQTGPQHLIALSPIGPPPTRPITEACVKGFASRYATVQPTTVYEIQHDWTMSFPRAVLDGESKVKLYDVAWPGVSSGDGRTPLFIGEYTPNEAMTASAEAKLGPSLRPAAFWNPAKSTPTMSIARGSAKGRVVATAQLFTNNTDFILHTPQYASPSSRTPTGYASHRSNTAGKATVRPAFTLWQSCSGPLLWAVRSVRTGNEARETRRLVLVDAYGRLVALVRGTGEASDGGGSKRRMARLEMYCGAAEELVGEVVAAYGALRYVRWSRARLGLAVAGLGEGLADVNDEV